MIKTWLYPDEQQQQALCSRSALAQNDITQPVQDILDNVRQHGDAAVAEYTRAFDGPALQNFNVTAEEWEQCTALVPAALQQAIGIAIKNIETFHRSQCIPEPVIETTKGVTCWRKNVAIEKVGLYIPGGTAPLFSTLLMLGIPAQIAGCKEIILCTPCDRDGKVNPVILYAAKTTGIHRVYKIGGAQAIAAMAFGTESIPRVNKIFGPGNQYVTKAKELVQYYGSAIDMPAGPSELLVIADETCVPAFVAADLLSQAEHGTDSQVILLTTSAETAQQVEKEIQQQIATLPRKEIALGALQHSFIAVLPQAEDCITFSNRYAPEHLIICTKEAALLAEQVVNAGSVFLGNYSCESAGDYASGPNHTLPTNGFAKSHSGVSVDSFLKKITFQQITPAGIQNLGPAIEAMAEAEGLLAHKNAVSIRLNSLTND